MDLNRASTFIRVVEAGGFSRAATGLNLPTSSVSRSVAKLEEELGVTLLSRTTRKVALTDAGRAYYERAREALAGLAEANALALDAAREAHGVVRVAVPPDMAAKIGAIVAPFLAQHPRIRVECSITSRGAELVGDLADLAVVFGKLPDSSLISVRLGWAPYRLYAAPAYLEARGQPRNVADLARHDGIFQRGVGGSGRWELVGPRGPEKVDVPARLIGDHINFVAEAATAGVGIALLPDYLGMAGARDGTLRAVLPRHSSDNALHVLSLDARHVPRRVTLLRDHLVEALTAGCKAHKL